MSKSKTFSSEIADRYALALYELSKEKNLTDEFEKNMQTFKKVYYSNQELRLFIKNPTHSVESQKIVFKQMLDLLNFNKLVKNFFLILIIKKRIFFLDQIVEKFLDLISLKKGIIKGNLISSKPIEEKTILEIEKEISANTKREIKLKSKVDVNLIGGIVIQVGSLMIDSSIQNKLQKYKKLMMEA